MPMKQHATSLNVMDLFGLNNFEVETTLSTDTEWLNDCAVQYSPKKNQD